MAIKQDIMIMRKEIDKSREIYFEKIVNVILTNENLKKHSLSMASWV